MKRETDCCFTGPRPPRLPAGGRENAPEMLVLREKLRRAVQDAYDDGYRAFFCGMAEGFDLLAAEAVLELCSKYSDAHLVEAFPSPESRTHHSPEVCKRIEAITAKSGAVIYCREHYAKGCELSRNAFMVRNCRRIIGYYNGLSNGTAHCWKLALSQGLEAVNLYDGKIFE